MLRFYRLIRKKLIEEQRIRQYGFYALGEIVLVVIGILIALQINNWNENRKEIAYQYVVLEDIKRALSSDVESYKQNLEILKSVNQGITNLLELRATGKKDISMSEFGPNANRTVQDISFGYNAGAYEGLKSIGVEKIRNTELRTQIVNYYEVTLPEISSDIRDNQNFFETMQGENREVMRLDKVFEMNFVNNPDSLSGISMNLYPEKMLYHPVYIEYLKNIMMEGLGHRSNLNRIIVEAENLMVVIEKELDR